MSSGRAERSQQRGCDLECVLSEISLRDEPDDRTSCHDSLARVDRCPLSGS
jgi:hypothetical protein